MGSACDASSRSSALVCPAPTTRRFPVRPGHGRRPRTVGGGQVRDHHVYVRRGSRHTVSASSRAQTPAGNVARRTARRLARAAKRSSDSGRRDGVGPTDERHPVFVCPSVVSMIPRPRRRPLRGVRRGQRRTGSTATFPLPCPASAPTEASWKPEPAAAPSPASQPRRYGKLPTRTAGAAKNDPARGLAFRVPSTGRPPAQVLPRR
jgi:hypothetical protein